MVFSFFDKIMQVGLRPVPNKARGVAWSLQKDKGQTEILVSNNELECTAFL